MPVPEVRCSVPPERADLFLGDPWIRQWCRATR
jgi:hypothetical protein